MIYAMTAAALIRDARRSAGLTQAQLASRLGVTQPTIAALERSGSNPRFATLERTLQAAGYRLRTTAQRLPIPDETQISERLRLTPADRLHSFHASQANLAGLLARARRV